jgi:hypothetical protein
MRMDQKALAMDRQDHTATGPAQERMAHDVLQALHLHAERGLAASDPFRGATQSAALGDVGEAAQQVDVQACSHQDS